jgi:predicted short-subunit dehydrogenase-like oxidoreductase (DUF2520 family)
LRQGGWSVAICAGSSASEARARKDGFSLAAEDAWKSAQLCFLCVPDRSVTSVAQDAAQSLPAKAALIHCSGALALSALGEVGGRPRGSFHPLCAVSHPHDALAGNAVAVAAEDERLRRSLKALARSLGMFPIDVPESGRIAYHAGAVLAAGGLVALASAAVDALAAAGVEREVALRALVPLMRSALRGVERQGLAHALTGPIARGDAATVRAHLAALPPELVPLYRALSLRSLKLAPVLEGDARAALELLLR